MSVFARNDVLCRKLSEIKKWGSFDQIDQVTCFYWKYPFDHKNVIFHGNCHFVTGLLSFSDNFFTIASEDTKGGGYTKNKGSCWRHQKLLTKIQIKNNPPRGLYFQIWGTALSPVITVILDGIVEIRYHGNDFYIFWKKVKVNGEK